MAPQAFRDLARIRPARSARASSWDGQGANDCAGVAYWYQTQPPAWLEDFKRPFNQGYEQLYTGDYGNAVDLLAKAAEVARKHRTSV